MDKQWMKCFIYPKSALNKQYADQDIESEHFCLLSKDRLVRETQVNYV